MSKYVVPQLDLNAFTCPSCGTYAQQAWSFVVTHRAYNGSTPEVVPIERCFCISCKAVSFWSKDSKSQIYPRAAGAPMPHPDMPKDASYDYLEARTIAADSPRAAAALLRLCVQKLMPHLGGKGKNIDDDIGLLVSKGLPPQVRDALDICRVVGNHAVHPGEIDVGDSQALVAQLFELVNFIVAQTIERERSLAALLGKLPQGAKDAMARRDAKHLSAVALPAPPAGT